MARKRTHIDLAEEYGVTIDVIKQASKAGVNVYKKEEFADHQSGKRHRIDPKAKMNPEACEDTTGFETLEQLQHIALAAHDLETVKIVKEKALAVKSLIAVEKEREKLITLPEIEERDISIAAALKAAVMEWENELPPMLEGKTASQIRVETRKAGIKLLQGLADEQSPFWRGKNK